MVKFHSKLSARAVRRDESPAGPPLEKDGREETIAPTGSVASSEPAAQLLAAEAGLGLAMLFEEHCSRAVAAGRLETVLADWCPPFAGPLLYYPERRLMPPGLRALVAFLRSATVQIECQTDRHVSARQQG